MNKLPLFAMLAAGLAMIGVSAYGLLSSQLAAPPAAAVLTAVPTAAVPTAVAPTAVPQLPEGVDADWQLRFSDEFDSGSVNAKNWSTCLPSGSLVDGDLKCIVDGKGIVLGESDNVGFAGGLARLEVAREKRTAFGKDYEYTFGVLSSHGTYTFTQGYAEIRAKFPAGKGLWPAFWLMPASLQWPPEIDVVEFLGREADTIHGTVHFLDASGKHDSRGQSFKTPGGDYAAEFHTYAVRWTPDELVWYLDGKEYHRVTGQPGVPQVPMYLIVSTGLGPPDSWGGPVGEDTVFPNYFDVDYVRVWSR
jgi:beta-glucanase (GH16 family)